MPPELLKLRCEEMGWDLIKDAEKLGQFKERVMEQKEKLEKDLETPVDDPWVQKLRENRKQMLKDKLEYIDFEEAKLMDKIVKLVECERRE